MNPTIEEYYQLFLDKKSVTAPITYLHGIHVDIAFVRMTMSIMGDGTTTYKIGTMIRQMDTFYRSSRKIEPQMCMNALEDSVEGLQASIDRLDVIHFSKKHNKFFFEDNESITYESLYKGTNYQTIYEECSVCMDVTKRKTKCKHPLCLPCCTKLKTPVCPLCRDCIIELDSDDEDE